MGGLQESSRDNHHRSALGRTAFAENSQQFTALNIWCLALFSLELKKEREKEKEKKKNHALIRVLLLLLEARINFLFYSSRRGSTLQVSY